MDIIRCIIVEDFQPLNDIYYNLLSYERDIEVIGRAYDGEQLEEILHTKKADVILLDIEMTYKTEGICTCKKILNEYPNLKIIMLSCHEEEDIILEAIEAGAVDYVLKTASSSKILEAVRAAYKDESCINSYVGNIIRKRMKEIAAYKGSVLYMANIISTLTASELDVLRLLVGGKKQKEISEARMVELVTVKAHTGSILRKFNMERTADMVNMIKETGLQSMIENVWRRSKK
jgi:DNA-binding NarL/FixJ family response regulator